MVISHTNGGSHTTFSHSGQHWIAAVSGADVDPSSLFTLGTVQQYSAGIASASAPLLEQLRRSSWILCTMLSFQRVTQAWKHCAVVNVGKSNQRGAAQAKWAVVSETPLLVFSCSEPTEFRRIIGPHKPRERKNTKSGHRPGLNGRRRIYAPAGNKRETRTLFQRMRKFKWIPGVCLFLRLLDFVSCWSPGARRRATAALMEMCLECFRCTEREK